MNTYIKEIEGKWYAFAGDETKNQVYSIGKDNPICGTWCGKWNNNGIKFVSCSSPSRSAAYKKAKRNGNYCGYSL